MFNALTKEKEKTFWYKFSKPCVIESNNENKNYNVDIAYKLKKVETDGEKQYRIDADLKGNVCIFFPAVKENSHLRFHINAPFASTVARDSVRDCSENKQLIREIANLCVCSLCFLKEKHCIDLGLYAALPNRRDFIDVTSAYYPIYSSILDAFKTQDFILTARGDYKKINEVLQTNREIARLIDDNSVEMLFKKSWIPSVNPQTNELYFLSDLGITQFDRKTIVEGMRHNSNFYDKLFDGKTAEWFRDWYVLLSEVQDVGFYKDVFKKVKMILGKDNNLYYATDKIYLENQQYEPTNLKKPLYVNLPDQSSSQNVKAKNFLEMMGIKEMSAEVDIMSDISGKPNVDKDQVILTLMNVIQMNDAGENINVFKNQAIFLGRAFSDDGKLYRVTAAECCYSDEVAFFYKNNTMVKYVLCREYYYSVFTTEKEMQSFNKVFYDLGGKIGPKIYSCQLTTAHPLYNQLNTDRERYDSCIKEDYSLTGVQFLQSIPEEKLYLQSKLLWDYLVEDKNFYHHIAKYRANGSRNIEQIDSTVAYWLRRIAWIPNKEGIFCRPCDITADNLYNGFEFDEKAIFLKNIGFGDKTKAPNDIVALLKKAGVKMSSTDEMFLTASEEDKQEFLKFLESKRSRKHETLTLSDALDAENKDQLPYAAICFSFLFA